VSVRLFCAVRFDAGTIAKNLITNKEMKKIMFAVMAIATLAFAGCEKDGNDAGEQQQQLDGRLVNTKWQTRDTVYEIIFGGTAYQVFEFISETEVEKYTTKNGNVVQSSGTYEYELDYPMLIIPEESDIYYTFEFTDSRTFVRVGSNGYAYKTYIKQ
jgi:hypothetical protein